MRVQLKANQMEDVNTRRFKYLREITEPCVWTDRMLTTLIKGVKRGKWYSLMDKLTSKENITKSAEKVIKNKGASGIDVEEKITDSKNIELIKSFLKQGVMEEMKYSPNEQGTPQGGIISPLLANIYLDGLDKQMESKGYKMIRYADDFVILCKSMTEAQSILEEVSRWMAEAKLTLNTEKTKIVNMTEERASFDFLGYTFMLHKTKIIRFPCRKSMTKFKDKIRILTKRCNGKSLTRIIEEIKPISRGWFEYYKHSIKNIFKELDAWNKMRIRSILRKRHGGKGKGRGSDHKKWPNEFFEEMGFYSLDKAYTSCRQPISSNS